MSDADWKCDLCGRKQSGDEKPPQGWVNTLRPCSFSGEMEDVAICGSCMACLDAARLADVNGLAEWIVENTWKHQQGGVPYNNEGFRQFIKESIAPLLAENERLREESDARFQMQAQRDEARAESERRLKLLVECRPMVQESANECRRDYELRPSSPSCRNAFEETCDLLTRIDKETGGAT